MGEASRARGWARRVPVPVAARACVIVDTAGQTRVTMKVIFFTLCRLSDLDARPVKKYLLIPRRVRQRCRRTNTACVVKDIKLYIVRILTNLFKQLYLT